MLTSIIQSLSTAFGDILEALLNAFLTALGMNLSSYLDVFPLLAISYDILRSFSVGMIAVIAGKSLASFWFGSDDGPSENVLRCSGCILGRLCAGIYCSSGIHSI